MDTLQWCMEDFFEIFKGFFIVDSKRIDSYLWPEYIYEYIYIYIYMYRKRERERKREVL